jgi:hypothetical protein
VFTCYSLTTIRREVMLNCNTLEYNKISTRKPDFAYTTLVPRITICLVKARRLIVYEWLLITSGARCISVPRSAGHGG